MSGWRSFIIFKKLDPINPQPPVTSAFGIYNRDYFSFKLANFLSNSHTRSTSSNVRP